MEKLNYCLVKKNKFYESIQDMLDLEDLSMNKPDDTENIIYKLKSLLSKSKFIEIKGIDKDKYIGKTDKDFTPNDLLEQIIVDITETNKNENIQGNTLLLYANNKYSFEVIYMENLIDEQEDSNINQFLSITNINLEPIYFDGGIIKTNYETNVPYNDKITIDDILEIIVSSFYHKGLMIEPEGKTTEILFSGDNPSILIGHNFKAESVIELLGLSFVPFVEKEDKNSKPNECVNSVFSTKFKGRVYLTLLSPISTKRHWNLNKEMFDDIKNIIDKEDIVKKIYEDIDKENKIVNPFFLIKKYCI